MKRIRIPALYRILNANTARATQDDDFGRANVELYQMLRAAWRLLSRDQKLAVFRQPELRELARHPDYREVFGHLTGDKGEKP